MDNSFDRLLKQKLAGKSPESLGLKPDRERLWQQVAAKKKGKGRLLPLWLSHTAAVAAGLLIAFLFLSREEKSVPQTQPATIARQETATKKDTVFVLQTAPGTGQQATTTVAAQPHRNTAAVVVPAPGQQATVAKIPRAETNAPVQQPQAAEPEQIVATAPRQARRVLHLADMNNENAIARPQRSSEPGGFLPANLSLPDGGENALSANAIQLFSKSKN